MRFTHTQYGSHTVREARRKVIMSYEELIEALMPVARTAGERIMDVYAKPAMSGTKGDGSPVTEADDAAETVILAALKAIAPEILVISEENAASHSLAAPERFFLVDPLDGTREFLKRDGKGAFTVNIALIEKGIPVMGLVYAPALNRMFSGSQATGAHEDRGDGPATIAARKSMPGQLVAVASESHRDAATNQWLANEGIKKTVSIGSSLKFCLLAAGEADVYPRFGPTMEWDTAAGDAVLRAAGGKVRLPQGEVMPYGKPKYRNGAFVAWGRE
jgi:3'(2'), 5'-bisphosphate nucleotidase